MVQALRNTLIGNAIGTIFVGRVRPLKASPRAENSVERRARIQVAVFEALIQIEQKMYNQPLHPIFLQAPYKSRIVGASPLVLWYLEQRGLGKRIIPHQNTYLRIIEQQHKSIPYSEEWKRNIPSLEYISIRAMNCPQPNEANVYASISSDSEYKSEYDGTIEFYVIRLRRKSSGWFVENFQDTGGFG